MDLKEVIKELENAVRLTGLKRSDIRIGNGSAMIFYGLREQTNDVDAAIPSDLFNELMKDKRFKVIQFKSYLDGSTRYIVNIGKVDIHNEDDTPDFKGPTKDFKGYRVYVPSTILKFKQKMNRPKDQADIKTLMAYVE